MEKKLSARRASVIDLFPAVRPISLPARSRTVNYVGSVTRVHSARVLKEIGKLLDRAPEEEIGLFVTSTGGPTGTAMSFYDTIRYVLKPKLTTIGSGDVDSSGITVFLAGDTRYLTKRTTLLLHEAGRVFDTQRYTVREMAAMLAEDRLKDEQYAGLIAERSRGKLTAAAVLAMMEKQTVLSPHDAVAYGLADTVLD